MKLKRAKKYSLKMNRFELGIVKRAFLDAAEYRLGLMADEERFRHIYKEFLEFCGELKIIDKVNFLISEYYADVEEVKLENERENAFELECEKSRAILYQDEKVTFFVKDRTKYKDSAAFKIELIDNYYTLLGVNDNILCQRIYLNDHASHHFGIFGIEFKLNQSKEEQTEIEKQADYSADYLSQKISVIKKFGEEPQDVFIGEIENGYILDISHLGEDKFNALFIVDKIKFLDNYVVLGYIYNGYIKLDTFGGTGALVNIPNIGKLNKYGLEVRKV